MDKYIVFDFYGVLYPDKLSKARLVVEKLRAQGYNIAAITNLNSKTAKKIAKSFKIDDLYICEEQGLSKVSGKIYEKFLQDHEIMPRQCVVVDDNLENLIPAKNLGMKTILYKGDDSRADYCIKELDEIDNLLKINL